MTNGSDPRSTILARLKAAPHSLPADDQSASVWAPPVYGAERLAKFRTMLEASHAEVHDVTVQNWPQRLKELLGIKGATRLLYAPNSSAGLRISQDWSGSDDGPSLIAYDRPVESMKAVLVDGVDAALTTARGGIAHTGSLVLWPTPDEPRLMSLLPPIHVVLLAETTVSDNLTETMSRDGWARAMPTNAVLVSGPSKTADIEQTLAYGVHGPKTLIVLIIRNEQATPMAKPPNYSTPF